MAYLRGYKCDICERQDRDEKQFIGLELSGKNASEMVVDSADVHICLRCADCIRQISTKNNIQNLDG
jgi:hypothetical protein